MCVHVCMSEPILVNGHEIGSTTSPTELVRVSYNGTECFVQLFFDEGPQITLINPQCTPIVCGSRQSERPIRIGSVLSEKSEIRPIQTIYLNYDHQIEGILVDQMVLLTETIKHPMSMSHDDGE